MKVLLSALALGASVCSAAPAAAQTVTIPDDPAAIDFDIVVRGERPLDRKEISDALNTLTKRYGTLQPLPRFARPLCVSVNGLGERNDRMIEQLIRANARILGLKLATPKCSPNAVVIVTDRPNEMYSALRKKRPELIGWRQSPSIIHDVSARTIRSELAANKPAVWWSDSIVVSADGASNLGPAGAQFIEVWQASRAAVRVSTQRRMAVVMFDYKQLDGVHIHQLADYATMHLFGSPQRSINAEDANVPTILTLFQQGPKAAPQQLTAFDRAYLCGLYDVPGIASPDVLASRLNQNVRQAYDSHCIKARPEAVLASAPAP